MTNLRKLEKGEHVKCRETGKVLLVVSHNHPLVYATRGDGHDGVGEVLLYHDEVDVVVADPSDGWVVK